MKLPAQRPVRRSKEKKAARLVARIFNLGRQFERQSRWCFEGCACGLHDMEHLKQLKKLAATLSRRAFTLYSR